MLLLKNKKRKWNSQTYLFNPYIKLPFWSCDDVRAPDGHRNPCHQNVCHSKWHDEIIGHIAKVLKHTKGNNDQNISKQRQ